MQTVTISMRLPKAEASRLDALARETGMARPTFLKRALRRGAADLIFDRACEAYRNGDATLSRAAQLAGISLRDMILRLQGTGLELNYGVDDLHEDLRE
jgi:predicted HTH domain antitoxin